MGETMQISWDCSLMWCYFTEFMLCLAMA